MTSVMPLSPKCAKKSPVGTERTSDERTARWRPLNGGIKQSDCGRGTRRAVSSSVVCVVCVCFVCVGPLVLLCEVV